MPREHPLCSGGAIAFALPGLFEKLTRRPMFGMMWVCHLGEDDFATDLGVIMHELGHIIVRFHLLCRRRLALQMLLGDPTT